MFTLVETFVSHQQTNLATDAFKFSVCKISDDQQGENCSNSSSVRVYVVVVVFESIYMAAFGILLVVYGFIPTPAREVWGKQLERLRRMFGCLRMK